MGSIPTAPGIAGKSEKTISFLAFSCFIHDNKMLAERTFYCSSSFRALFFGCQPGGIFYGTEAYARGEWVLCTGHRSADRKYRVSDDPPELVDEDAGG